MAATTVTATAPPEPRLLWLDGLRGIAAAQVVLMHYTSAFLPGVGLPDPALQPYLWERIIAGTPLYAVLNGSAAVNLFFLLSGVALTFSFARQPFAIGGSALRRVIRLGIPMAVATAIAGGLLAIWPRAHVDAAQLTMSISWLGAISPRLPTVAMTAHQILLEGMFAGYSDMTLLPHWAADRLGLAPLFASVNAPLWTLHIELVGSLLVLWLVPLQAVVARWVHLAVCAMLMALLITSPLVLFIVGHVLAPVLQGGARGFGWRVLGMLSLAVGIGLASAVGLDAVRALLSVLPQPPLGPVTDLLHFQFMLAGLFMFLGVVLLPTVQSWLNRRIPQALGRVSFGLYLTHFPLLFTVVSVWFLRLQTVLPFGLAVLVAMIAGMAGTLACAMLFTRWVDRPAIRLSRMPTLVLSRQKRML